jgi:gluconolactonase
MSAPRRAFARALAAAGCGTALAAALVAPARAERPSVPEGEPAAAIDLATREGAALARATWRYHDARIVEREHRAPDDDGQPTGAAIRTHDLEPRAGRADFDDSAWEAIAPESLAARRAGGRLCFAWYRVRVTIPERIGAFDPSGSTVVFETAVDDYAEVWVDGELPRAVGQRGGSVVAGFNASNRLVVVRDASPGQQLSLAVFGANGPLSDAPANFIWIREARLSFYREAPRGAYAVEADAIRVVAPDGRPLGALRPPRPPDGLAWREGDPLALYLSARGGLYRLPLRVAGIRP